MKRDIANKDQTRRFLEIVERQKDGRDFEETFLTMMGILLPARVPNGTLEPKRASRSSEARSKSSAR